MTKSTLAKVEKIKALKKKGLSTAEACKKMKISASYYYHITTRPTAKLSKPIEEPTVETKLLQPWNLKVVMSDGTEFSVSGDKLTVARAIENITTW